jgi:hypothetical protein
MKYKCLVVQLFLVYLLFSLQLSHIYLAVNTDVVEKELEQIEHEEFPSDEEIETLESIDLFSDPLFWLTVVQDTLLDLSYSMLLWIQELWVWGYVFAFPFVPMFSFLFTRTVEFLFNRTNRLVFHSAVVLFYLVQLFLPPIFYLWSTYIKPTLGRALGWVWTIKRSRHSST